MASWWPGCRAEAVVVEIQYVSPDGSEEGGPGSLFRAVGGKLEAPGLPAEGRPALLVGSIAKTAKTCTHEDDCQQVAAAGAEISTSGASPLGPIGHRADCGAARTDRDRLG